MSTPRIFFTAVALLVAGPSHLIASSLPVEEVPFITTPDHVTLAMLELAEVGAQDHVLDLGSGDGRIVITAVRRFGASGLGLEIVPDLVAQSEANARRAGVADRARFRVQDLFEADLSAASVVTMYLLPEVNLQLRPRLLALAPGTRIVSHDWDMGEWEPDRTVTLPVPDKAVGREKSSRLHLWRVPAPVQGRWCAGAFAGRDPALPDLPRAAGRRWPALRLVGTPARCLVGSPGGEPASTGPDLARRRVARGDRCPGLAPGHALRRLLTSGLNGLCVGDALRPSPPPLLP